jgi:hypothetical protein
VKKALAIIILLAPFAAIYLIICREIIGSWDGLPRGFVVALLVCVAVFAFEWAMKEFPK